MTSEPSAVMKIRPNSSELRCQLTHHHLHQLPKAVHHVVFHIFRGKAAIHFIKKPAGAFDLGFFDFAQLQAGHAALGLCHEVNVLDAAFLEADGPVGVVVAHRGGDQKASGQLGVDHHLFGGIQLCHELSLDL